MEQQLRKWTVDEYDLHEPWEHGADDVVEQEGTLFVVDTPEAGPEAVMLERALVLNGLAGRARCPQPGSSELEDGLDRLRFSTALVLVGNKKMPVYEYLENTRWPERADQILIDVVWEANGGTRVEPLESDIAFPPSAALQLNEMHPVLAHPVITRSARMTPELVTSMLLGAYSGPGCCDLDADTLDEHRASVIATVDILFNGREGRLCAIQRLITERVMSCLADGFAKGKAVTVNLWNDKTSAVEVEETSNEACDAHALPQDPESARERTNRLRYENTSFRNCHGVLIGRYVPLQSTLANTVLKLPGGIRLWEPGSQIEGRLLPLSEHDRVLAETAFGTTTNHAVAWRTGTTADRAETVHLLNGKEVDRLLERTTGPIFDGAIEALQEGHGLELLPKDHPLLLLAKEYKRRADNLC